MRQRPTLKTDRLVLRPFEPSDAKGLQRLAGDRAAAAREAKARTPSRRAGLGDWLPGATHRNGGGRWDIRPGNRVK